MNRRWLRLLRTALTHSVCRKICRLAAWDLIGEAKRTLSIPVVGNGDVTTAEKAMALRAATGCDAIMVGRGVVQDPLVFHRIRRAWGQPAEAGAEERAASEAEAVEGFLRAFAAEVAEQARLRQPRRNRKGHAVQSARLKQVANYLFQSNEGMAAALQQFQRTTVQVRAVVSTEFATFCVPQVSILRL